MAIGPRIIVLGDEELGNQYRETALLELTKLKELMGFQSLKQDQRKTVFEDGTVIRCQSVFGQDTITIETLPIKAEEEKEKEYEEGGLFIVLKSGTDYWYWDLGINQGYHVNPQAEIPIAPEIVSKWGGGAAEQYTRLTPALETIEGGEGDCEDACGLLNFVVADCCEVAQSKPDEYHLWYACPCGGTGVNSGCGLTAASPGLCVEPYSYIPGFIYSAVPPPGQCVEGTTEGTPYLYRPGTQDLLWTYNNFITLCPVGYSWKVIIDELDEKIEVGPRTIQTGKDNSGICTLEGAVCSPIQHLRSCYTVFDIETCFGFGSDQSIECHDVPLDSGGRLLKEGGRLCRLSPIGGGSDGGYGCIDVSVQEMDGATYKTENVPLVTKIALDSKEISFEGEWNIYSLSGRTREGSYRWGNNDECISCAGRSGCGPCDMGDWKEKSSFTFTEQSVGMGGWATVVTEDGGVAVLIPLLSLSASVIEEEGIITGSMESTTTALLRIADEGETDYELGEADKDISLDDLEEFPETRKDLGLKPESGLRDLPLAIELRGFHWLAEEQEDNILSAFVMDSSFYAHLTSKATGENWQNAELTKFEQWVVDNSLESYAMFLYRRRENEEEILY
jgi:hypothetical protein